MCATRLNKEERLSPFWFIRFFYFHLQLYTISVQNKHHWGSSAFYITWSATNHRFLFQVFFMLSNLYSIIYYKLDFWDYSYKFNEIHLRLTTNHQQRIVRWFINCCQLDQLIYTIFIYKLCITKFINKTMIFTDICLKQQKKINENLS